MIEYIIWGILPNESEESIVLTVNVDKEPIKDKSEALQLLNWCKSKGARDLRIQEVDLLSKYQFIF
jgi:hypothetical protein